MIRSIRPYVRSRHVRQITMATSVTSPVKLAVCQMRATNDKQRNYDICRGLIEKAREAGAKMVFLPECFDYVGCSADETRDLAETVDERTVQAYRELARRQQVWISLGGMHRKAPDDPTNRIYNTHLILDHQGQVQGQYDKTHLFDLDLGEVKLKETDRTIPGSKLGRPVATPCGKVGLEICYDLRFPEMSRAQCELGAEILTFPSAFTVPTGQAHWHTLLRARAIENQCYVVAAAQMGKHHEKRTSYGHSLVVDPWGKVLAECTEENEVQLAEVDLEYLRKVRRDMPCYKHRRPDVYSQLHTAPGPDQPSYQFGHVTVTSDCVFYRTSLTYCFVNIKPVVPGHTLISPIEPVEKLVDLSPRQTEDLFISVQKVVRVLQKVYDTDSVTVSVQDGPLAGQTVKHVHVHILPRKPGDFTENDDIYHKLEHHDDDMGSQGPRLRSREEMAAEATMMRLHFS